MSKSYEARFHEVLNTLNEGQRSAVDIMEGPVLVVAGPGTGKTQILSTRIGNILNTPELQTDPQNILCLTYTESGSLAMRERLLEIIGPEAYKVHIFTFHAFCNQVIQDNLDHFGLRDLQLISELESLDIFYRIVDEFPADHKLKRFSGDVYFEVRRLRSLFDTMKREAWSPEYVSEKIDAYLEDIKYRDEYYYKRSNSKQGYKAGDFKQRHYDKEAKDMEKLRAAAMEFHKYEQYKRYARRYDYNDMILWVLQAFREDEDLLLDYQEQYLYFLVDEYQDTNGAQNELLNLLAGFWEVPNVFVVGDDDQSIFRFQGANVKNIMDFFHTYHSQLHTVVLTENYRSTQPVLDAAQALIENNSERLVNKIEGLDKNLHAAARQGEAPLPRVKAYHNPAHEEAALIDKLERFWKEGRELNEIAVIYRKHNQVANIIKVLEDRGVPVNIRRKINILFHPLIRNVIRIFEYINAEYKKPFQQDDLLYEILHYPFFNNNARDIARIAAHLGRQQKQNRISWRSFTGSRDHLWSVGVEDPDAFINTGNLLTSLVGDLPSITLQILFERLLTKGGILSYIMNHQESTFMMQVVSTFFDFIKEETAREPSMTLEALLTRIQRMEDNRIELPVSKTVQTEKGINFITAHSAKGNEFEEVYLLGCNAGIWENQRGGPGDYKFPDTLIPSVPENKTEEERRLFYVAMTRAKKHLEMSWWQHSRDGKELGASQFIAELREAEKVQEETISLDKDSMTGYYFAILNEVERPKVSLLDHDYIERMLQGYKMSVTHLNKYLRCPVSFYFENLLRVPSARNADMGYGQAVHYALKKLFMEMRNDPDRNFPGEQSFWQFFSEGMHIYRSHFTDHEYTLRLQKGEQELLEYYNHYVEHWNKVVALEYPIRNVEVNGVPITGVLDKIEFNGHEAHVVDYKTGNPDKRKGSLKAPGENEPDGGEYWRQLVFYKILVDNDKSKPWHMVSGEMDFVQKDNSNKFYKGKVAVSPEESDFLIERIEDTYRRIMNHEFDTGCGDPNCQWCNFIKNNYSSTELELITAEEDQ